MKYKYTGTYPDTLASGQPVAPGDLVDLDDDAVQANKSKIETGSLVSAEGGKADASGLAKSPTPLARKEEK